MSETTQPALKPCLLIYDIPDAAEIPNPSGRLMRLAVRVNLSCWVIPEDRIPYHLLNEMEEGGATWHVVQFADHETPKLMEMARKTLAKEIEQGEKRFSKSMTAADAQLDATVAENTEKADRQHQLRTRAALRRAKLLMESLDHAARIFSVGVSSVAAYSRIEALHAATSERARLMVEAAREAARVGGDDPMAEAAAADLVPAGILADYIEDHGGDGSALREAFAVN